MKSSCILIAITLLFAACGKAPQAVPVSGHPLAEIPAMGLTAADLVGRDIDDLIILVFRAGGDSARWQTLFTDAARFSLLRAQNRADEIESNHREIITILGRLATKETAFLVQFTSMAGCAFGEARDERHVAIRCDWNAMAGAPHLDEEAEIITTRRNGREISPAVRLRLHSPTDSDQWGLFALSLDLVPELHDGVLTYKGTVTVDEGSSFFWMVPPWSTIATALVR